MPASSVALYCRRQKRARAQPELRLPVEYSRWHVEGLGRTFGRSTDPQQPKSVPKTQSNGEGDWWKVKMTPRADPQTTTHQRARTARSHSLAPRLHVHAGSITCATGVKPTPLPHHAKHSFPPIFTRFPTYTTNHATRHSLPIHALPHPHPIPHVPSPPQCQWHACTARAHPPRPACPETPSLRTTCPHATVHMRPMPWSATPQPHRSPMSDTPCMRWNHQGGNSTHLHDT